MTPKIIYEKFVVNLWEFLFKKHELSRITHELNHKFYILLYWSQYIYYRQIFVHLTTRASEYHLSRISTSSMGMPRLC